MTSASKEFWALNSWSFKYLHSLKPHYTWATFFLNLLDDVKSLASIAIFAWLLNFALRLSSSKSLTVYDTLPILVSYGLFNAGVAVLDFSRQRLRTSANNYFNLILKKLFYSRLSQIDDAPTDLDLVQVVESLPQLTTNYFQTIKVGSNIVSFFITGAILALFIPLIIPILLVLILPQFLLDSKFRKRLAKSTKDLTAPYKADASMAANLLNSDRLKSLKDEGLTDYIAGRFLTSSQNYTLVQSKIKTSWLAAKKTLWAASDAATVAGFAIVLSKLAGNGTSIGNVYLQLRLLILFKSRGGETLDLLDSLFDSTPKLQQAVSFFSLQPTPPAGISLPDTPLSLNISDLTYPTGDSPKSLSTLSFSLAPGEKLAIIATSGPHRAALYQILSGQIADYTGTVSLNSTDLKLINRQSFRNQVATLSTANYFHHLSAKENVALGRPNQSPDDAAITSALEAAGATAEVVTLAQIDPPPKLKPELVVKLLVARLIYRQPQLVIVNLPPLIDSNPNSAYKIVQALCQGLPHQSLIVFSLWPPVGKLTTKMAVLSQDKISKQGTYDQLYPAKPAPDSLPASPNPVSIVEAANKAGASPDFQAIVEAAKHYYSQPESGLLKTDGKITSTGHHWIYFDDPSRPWFINGEPWRVGIFGPPAAIQVGEKSIKTLVVRFIPPAKYKSVLRKGPDQLTDEEKQLRNQFNAAIKSKEYPPLLFQVALILNHKLKDTKDQIFVPLFGLELADKYDYDVLSVFGSAVSILGPLTLKPLPPPAP